MFDDKNKKDIHKLDFVTHVKQPWVKKVLLAMLAVIFKPVVMAEPADNKPGGVIERADKKDLAPENIRALELQEEGANILAQAGFKIDRLPKSTIPGQKNPDFKIESEIFDHVAFTSPKARNIWKRILDEKVSVGQADRVVINITDSKVTVPQLKRQFNDYPMPGLKEAIVITKDKQIIHLWPSGS